MSTQPCVKCGAPLEQGARFCGGCGTQQPGAVIPQAAVRTGAKTLFQGSGGIPVVKPSDAPKPTPASPSAVTLKPTPAPDRSVAVPDKKGPVSSAMSFAATMAPGSVEMKALAPPPSTATPGKAP